MYLYVGIGGIIGSILRYFISQFPFLTWNHLPISTLFVNWIGAFLLGWFTSRILPLKNISQEVKTGFSSGFIGSYTTFSTLSVETMQLIQETHYDLAVIYLALSIIGGLALTALGYLLGQGEVKGH